MGVYQEQLRELRLSLDDLSEDLSALEALWGVDVPSSLNKIRFITEKVLPSICTAKKVSWGAGHANV